MTGHLPFENPYPSSGSPWHASVPVQKKGEMGDLVLRADIGMAPEAEIAGGLVLPGGSGRDAQNLGVMQWAIGLGVDVISLGLGGPSMSADVDRAYVSLTQRWCTDCPRRVDAFDESWSVGQTDRTDQPSTVLRRSRATR